MYHDSKEAKLNGCAYFGEPIPYDAKWRNIWDFLVITAAIYSTFTIPVAFAFSPPFTKELWFIFTDWFTTLIYLIDIVIQFRTTYVDQFGSIIRSYNSIAINYITSASFWLDSISLLANPATDKIYWIKFVGILKITRVFRIREIISAANVDKTKKALLKAAYFIFLLSIYIHLTGCIWFYVLANSKEILSSNGIETDERELEWVPPFWFNNYKASNFWSVKECTPEECFADKTLPCIPKVCYPDLFI